MAYKKGELEKRALQLIESEKLYFHSDVWPLLGVSERTYYNHKLQELQSIKEALEKNRVRIKTTLRAKWQESNSAALQLALYKLVGTPDEIERLSMHNIKQRIEEAEKEAEKTAREREANAARYQEVDYSKLSDSALEELLNALKPREAQ